MSALLHREMVSRCILATSRTSVPHVVGRQHRNLYVSPFCVLYRWLLPFVCSFVLWFDCFCFCLADLSRLLVLLCFRFPFLLYLTVYLDAS